MAESNVKEFTLAEVAQASSASKPLLVISNSVYDVTNFLNEHPGGEEVLLEQAGKDATEHFEDVGHSSDAREMMKKYKIGDLAESDRKQAVPKEKPKWEAIDNDNSSSLSTWLISAAIAIAATIFYRYWFSK